MSWTAKSTIRIAIIGGGATGALAALQLARVFPNGGADIVVIEPEGAIGRGLAYSTDDPGHLLNVRVANMSAYPDQPDHLLTWLNARKPEAAAGPFSFIPRKVYGDYLADLAAEAMARGAFRHLQDRCIDLAETDEGVDLDTSAGEHVRADHVVLAMGHDSKPMLGGMPAEQPWTAQALGDLPPDARILIVGTGLTMVDMALSLDRLGHKGAITAVSRRGLASFGHRPIPARAVAAQDVPFGAELSHLLRWLRGLAEGFTREGADWRSAIDALRPHTRRLWRSMSVAQKRRFLRHARPYWDVRRHRMAPEVEAQIEAMRASGRLSIVAARVLAAAQDGSEVRVELIRRRASGSEVARFGRIIDCSGLPDDVSRAFNPVIRALLRRGLGRSDPLGIGLDIADDYAVIDANGRPSHRISAIGPLARAAFWESIAIPDIRVQCQELAEALAAPTEP